MALDNGSAFELAGWKYVSEAFLDNTVHFIGLLSDGGVHSRYDQLLGFIKGAAKDGAKRIRVHILTVSLLCPSTRRQQGLHLVQHLTGNVQQCRYSRFPDDFLLILSLVCCALARAECTCMAAQDGRDVPDGTSVKFTEQLQSDLAALQGVDAKIASGGGRMGVTMDRYEVCAAPACECILCQSLSASQLMKRLSLQGLSMSHS
jgi:bisphosphoglycerate-independent phosphoglycerate mutase (AlkP superfamily)